MVAQPTFYAVVRNVNWKWCGLHPWSHNLLPIQVAVPHGACGVHNLFAFQNDPAVRLCGRLLYRVPIFKHL